MRHISEAWLRRHGSFRARVSPHGKLILEHDACALEEVPYHVAFTMFYATVELVAIDGKHLWKSAMAKLIVKPAPGTGLTVKCPGEVVVPRGTANVQLTHRSRIGSVRMTVPVVRDLRELPRIEQARVRGR